MNIQSLSTYLHAHVVHKPFLELHSKQHSPKQLMKMGTCYKTIKKKTKMACFKSPEAQRDSQIDLKWHYWLKKIVQHCLL